MPPSRYSYEDILKSNERVVKAIEGLGQKLKGDGEEGRAATLAVVVSQLTTVQQQLDKGDRKFDQLTGIQSDHAERITKIEGKVNGFAAVQAVWTLVLSAIAGWFGSKN